MSYSITFPFQFAIGEFFIDKFIILLYNFYIINIMRGEFILNLDKSSYRSFSTIEEAYGMKD